MAPCRGACPRRPFAGEGATAFLADLSLSLDQAAIDGRLSERRDLDVFHCVSPGAEKAKRLERNDSARGLDAGDGLYLFIHKVADVGLVLDVELNQQIEI